MHDAPIGFAMTPAHSIQRLLVAIDGSDEARRAVQLAADLAGRYRARLVVAHVVPNTEELPSGEFQSFQEAVERAGVELLEDTSEHIRLPVDQVETKLLRGEPPTALCELADQLDADLVVIGSRGLGAVGRMLLGSVSDRLLHSCKRPVLIVR